MKLKEFRQWLEQDERLLDAFISQHYHVMQHLKGLWIGFVKKGEDTMPILAQPTVIPPQKISPPQPLPNAKVGESYQYPLNMAARVEIPAECGLVWNSAEKRLEGTPDPQMAGQEIKIQAFDQAENQTTYILYINQNPRSLWKNIPSEPTTLFHKPDSANKERFTSEGWLIGARQRGRSHAHHGTCCDDDFAFDYDDATKLHFIAVADGAGSAEFSRLGSKIAVDAACSTFSHLLHLAEKSYKELPYLPKITRDVVIKGLIDRAVQEAYQQQQTIAQQYAEHISSAKALSCTLLLAFTFPQNNGKWLTVAYWIGDGAIALIDTDTQSATLLGESDSGLFSGETEFLSAQAVHNLHKFTDLSEAKIWIKETDSAPILLLMTDGVSDPKFKSEAELQKSENWLAFWQELKAPLSGEQPATALEEWLDFWSVGEHDDRTLVGFIPQQVVEKLRPACKPVSEVGEVKLPAVVTPASIVDETKMAGEEPAASTEAISYQPETSLPATEPQSVISITQNGKTNVVLKKTEEGSNE